MNLCLFGYYHFADGYYSYGQYFKNYFKTVSFFPLIEFTDQNRTDISDIEKIVSGEIIDTSKYTASLINVCVPKQIIIVAHSNEIIAFYKKYFDYLFSLQSKYNFKIIQINWDPLLNNLGKPVYNFDLSFCCDPLYLSYKKTFYFQPGFSPLTSYYEFDSNYECDVSFVGTNLYTNPKFPNQKLNRQKILDLIYADKSIKLHIYGPKKLGEIYPDSYRGYLKSKDCNRVFSSSKININISPINDSPIHKKKYGLVHYSDRLSQLLACYGVALCNNNFDPVLRPNYHYLLLESLDQLIPTIKYYINHPSELEKMKSRIREISHKFNYENIIKKVSGQIIKSYKLNQSLS